VSLVSVKKSSQRKSFIALALLLMSGLIVLLYRTPPTEWDRAKQFGEFIHSQGAAGVLVFFIVATLATSIGLPRQLFAFAAGFAFGVPAGVLLSSFAALGGCAITFLCSRRWLSKQIQSRYPNAVKKLNSLLNDDVFLKILILRLQPLGTNLVTNLCAGVTTISAAQFLASTWIGYLPQMMVFCLLGAGVRIGSNTYLLYSVSMLAITVVVGGWLYKRYIDQTDGTTSD